VRAPTRPRRGHECAAHSVPAFLCAPSHLPPLPPDTVRLPLLRPGPQLLHARVSARVCCAALQLPARQQLFQRGVLPCCPCIGLAASLQRTLCRSGRGHYDERG
jgi:hypothetical protein